MERPGVTIAKKSYRREGSNHHRLSGDKQNTPKTVAPSQGLHLAVWPGSGQSLGRAMRGGEWRRGRRGRRRRNGHGKKTHKYRIRSEPKRSPTQRGRLNAAEHLLLSTSHAPRKLQSKRTVVERYPGLTAQRWAKSQQRKTNLANCLGSHANLCVLVVRRRPRRLLRGPHERGRCEFLEKEAHRKGGSGEGMGGRHPGCWWTLWIGMRDSGLFALTACFQLKSLTPTLQSNPGHNRRHQNNLRE